MRVSELIGELRTAKERYGDVPVSVSVDLDTGESEGRRCFGDVIGWNPGGGNPAPEIVLIAESGTLNYV